MKKRLSLNDALAAFVLVIYFVELVFPMITTLLPGAMVRLVCFFLWLFFVTTVDYKFLLVKSNFILLTIYLYFAIYPILFGNQTISNRYLSMSLVLCGSLVFRYYYTYGKMNILKKVLIITITLSSITMVITYAQLLINPYISRSIKSSGEYSVALARQGVGGYTFIYYITALSIPALYYGLKIEQKWKRICAIAWYAFSVVFIIKSNYLTAFLTIIVCSVALMVLLATSNKKLRFVSTLFSGLVLITLAYNLDSIISLIAEYLPSRISSVLISGGGDSVTNSIMQEFLIDRWPTIQESIDSFFKYPLWGMIGHGAVGFDGNFLTGFGQHSFVFDTFALFGIFGGVIGTYATLNPLKKSAVWDKHSAFRIAMIVCIVMLYFLNNATESIALVVSVIAPFVCSEISTQNDEKNEYDTLSIKNKQTR